MLKRLFLSAVCLFIFPTVVIFAFAWRQPGMSIMAVIGVAVGSTFDTIRGIWKEKDVKAL